MKGQNHRRSGSRISDQSSLAILGHELGNVLHGLLGMAEILGDSGLTPDQCRWLQAIEQSGRQMASLLRSAVCDPSSSGPDIVPEPGTVDGVDILEQIVTSHTPAARARGNRLLLNVHPKLPRFWRQDACLVRQLLDNLVGNAIKFTRSGDIVIGAEPAGMEGRNASAIRLCVTDTGPGIEKTMVACDAARPAACDASNANGTGDRGLGLYICRNIVTALQGRIMLSSPDCGGARFEVILPGISGGRGGRDQRFKTILLETLVCELTLEDTLGDCVANFLARLGVRYYAAGGGERPASDEMLELRVSEAGPRLSGGRPCLLIAPSKRAGCRPGPRLLKPPLLESSLAGSLLVIALDWRNRSLRSENRD